jgi:hypothetical protein
LANPLHNCSPEQIRLSRIVYTGESIPDRNTTYQRVCWHDIPQPTSLWGYRSSGVKL